MPTSDLTDRKVINGILTAAIIGLIAWNLNATHENSKAIARIEGILNAVYSSP